MKKALILTAIFLLNIVQLQAQCSMCRAVVQNNADNLGQGLNNGILYLMGFPYIIIIVVGTILFRKRQKDQQLELN
tara:strand:+ start:530 stop:757 length:228 start_codon:yes stop_codon:yes gene_type:complete